MEQVRQFEVWQRANGRWELVASFLSAAPAGAVASNRCRNVRMFEAVYEDGSLVSQDFYVRIEQLRESVDDAPQPVKKGLFRRHRVAKVALAGA